MVRSFPLKEARTNDVNSEPGREQHHLRDTRFLNSSTWTRELEMTRDKRKDDTNAGPRRVKIRGVPLAGNATRRVVSRRIICRTFLEGTRARSANEKYSDRLGHETQLPLTTSESVPESATRRKG